jgi:hypothetical protein
MKRASATSSLALALALVLLSGAAHAQQNDKALAKEAYDRGTQAHERGDFRRAAEEFARADALAPSPVALQAALDAAVEADDPILGAELLERSKRGTAAAGLATSIEAATRKLGGRAGRVRVTCPGGARCVSTVDGAALDATKGVWLRVGAHKLVVQVDGATDTRTVEIRAGETTEVVPSRVADKPAPIPPPLVPTPGTPPQPVEPARHKPLPPLAVWIGVGATVVLAGGATVFAFRTKQSHGDFVDAGCDRVATSTCADLKDDGESNQTIANAAFALTAVAGVATVVLGAFFVDWDRGAKAVGKAPVLVPIAGGMAASYAVRF